MRSSRLKKTRNKHIKFISILCFFTIIIPMSAVMLSIFISSLYDNNTIVYENSNTKYAFNYIFDFANKKLYRIQIKKFDEYSKALEFIEDIKLNNINAFVIKQNGYSVIFGLFTEEQAAQAVSQMLLGQDIQCTIEEKILEANNIQFEFSDHELLKTLKEINNNIYTIMDKKSDLSLKMIKHSDDSIEVIANDIFKMEATLEKQLDDLMQKTSANTQSDFLKKYIYFLKELVNHKLKQDMKYNYYSIQNSLLNQFEAYNRFVQAVIV